MVSGDKGEMQEMHNSLVEESEEAGLKVNTTKTKVMSNTTGKNLVVYRNKNCGEIHIPW